MPLSIGENCLIGEKCVVSAAQIGNYVHLGDNCIIGENSFMQKYFKSPEKETRISAFDGYY